MKVWTVEEIKDLVQTNDVVLYRALLKLYNCQTESEKQDKATRDSNGMGFNAYDAEILTSFCDWLIKNGFLTSKQKFVARKKLVKYSKQLTALANT